jgi:hypothetical protein
LVDIKSTMFVYLKYSKQPPSAALKGSTESTENLEATDLLFDHGSQVSDYRALRF